MFSPFTRLCQDDSGCWDHRHHTATIYGGVGSVKAVGECIVLESVVSNDGETLVIT